jgi:tyrosine-protein phosphatase YwqE
MQLAGYKPVLAHPERYAFYHRQFEKYTEYADKGVLLQLNMNSLTGHYSPEVKKIAERMVDENLISLIGSDCHHYGHIQLLEQASKGEAMHKLLDSGKLINTSL